MTNMNGIYSNNRGKRKGKDKGSHMVYHISVKSHRGIHQGYVGVSLLDLKGVKERYKAEIEEAFSDEYSRKPRRVLSMMRKYQGQCTIKALATGMTKEEALDLESRLRPHKNAGEHFCKFNWNSDKGGKS